MALVDQDVHVIQLLLGNSGGSVHHQVLRGLVHGEGDDLADGLLTAQQHDHAVDAGGCAGMGRRAVGEGIVHGGELGLHVSFAQAHHLEGLDHDLGIMVTDSAGSALVAVDDQVILAGVDGQQLIHIALGIQQGFHTALGHGEGVVAEFQLARLLAHLVHGEVHDPAEGVLLLVEVAGNTLAQQGADNAGGLLGGNLLGCGGHADEGAGLQVQLGGQGGIAVVQELGDTAGEGAVLVHLEPADLVAGLNFHVGEQLVDPLAALREVVNGDGLDGGVLEGAEGAAGHLSGDVLDLQVDTQVGLVGAVALHGLIEADAAEGVGGDPVVLAELHIQGLQHLFQSGQHVVLGGEGHLHVQLIELAGGTVGTGVLITEAGSDLEVLVEAGGHQQLLELLGSLGQGIELAGVVTGGNQVVAGTLGGGGGEDGGGDLQEALLGHGGTDGGNHLAAQDDVLLHGGVAQVQVAVLQAHVLVSVPGLVDLEGQLIVDALAQDLNGGGHHLDLAGGHLIVLALALPDGAGDGDGGFLVQTLDGAHHLGVLNDHLGGAVVVAQDHEGEVGAHLTDVLHPADQGNIFTCVGKTKLAAVMCSGLLHSKKPLLFCNLTNTLFHNL